jgi:hypothetical protein
LSSFWLALKQQWTIKISSPLFLFLVWRPSWLEVGITGHNLERGPSKDHSTKVWLQLAQWFLRRRLKCEMLTGGRRTKSDGNGSPGLRPGELKTGGELMWPGRVGSSLWQQSLYLETGLYMNNSSIHDNLCILRHIFITKKTLMSDYLQRSKDIWCHYFYPGGRCPR